MDFFALSFVLPYLMLVLLSLVKAHFIFLHDLYSLVDAVSEHIPDRAYIAEGSLQNASVANGSWLDDECSECTIPHLNISNWLQA